MERISSPSESHHHSSIGPIGNNLVGVQRRLTITFCIYFHYICTNSFYSRTMTTRATMAGQVYIVHSQSLFIIFITNHPHSRSTMILTRGLFSHLDMSLYPSHTQNASQRGSFYFSTSPSLSCMEHKTGSSLVTCHHHSLVQNTSWRGPFQCDTVEYCTDTT